MVEDEVNPLKSQRVAKNPRDYQRLVRRKQQKIDGWLFHRRLDDLIG